MKGRSNLFRDVYQQPYTDTTRSKLYRSTKGSLDLIQRLCLLKKLPVHNGCVNSICWNETGEYILSGSDDQHLVVTHGYNFKVLTNYKTSHRANIFSAKFLPNSGDNNIISCSGDGIILYTDLMRKEETYYNQFNCHSGTTYEVITIPNDPHSFLSCGEDGTVRWFDLRMKDKCNKPQCKEDVMITCQRAVTALSVNPVAPYQLAIGCSDSTVRMFDRRMLGTKASGGALAGGTLRPLCSFTVPSFEDRSYRITSLTFSPEGEEILVSYSSDHLYLFSVKDHSSTQLKAGSEATSGMQPESDKKGSQSQPAPVRRLRLRGDWSDTGPDARPEREGGRRGEIAQARPTLHATLMQRMTDVLSRMLNDPATRAALSGGGEDSLEGDENQGADAQAVPSQSTETLPLNDISVETASSSQPSSSSSISVPQISSLSIHSTMPEAVESSNENIPSSDSTTAVSYTQNISNEPEAAEELPVTENNNALDLSQVPQLSVCSIEQPISSDTLGESERNETDSESVLPEHSVPSQQQDCSESSRSSVLMPDSELVHHNISNLQDQLSTMREGFIERHRSEPAVSLVYSDKSSTGAKISLGLGDEVSRELHESSNSNQPEIGSGETVPSSSPKLQSEMETSDAVAGPSQDLSPSSQDATNRSSGVGFDGEDDYNDSDEEGILMTTGTRRFIHPIEEHMDEAIAAVRHDKEMVFDEQSILQPAVKQKYIGHRNARTMIKEATFWGSDYVLSGSDCGHVFIWNRYSGELVMLLEADHHVVNCLQPHPVLPLLATSGIDYDVKLWAPLHDEPSFDKDLADILTERNEVMLEETKDTITVPASFMIRMLACLNQIRRGGRNRARNGRRQNSGEDSGASN
ncbi:DDB1- and CUL4-associated factor 6-like [Periplaneta americana]|uniref:DDB1- and CUL4-associated factor 6-like n=1 Tax=Periplaneta americana TaxID=6978 RepID=UPI0037E7B852